MIRSPWDIERVLKVDNEQALPPENSQSFNVRRLTRDRTYAANTTSRLPGLMLIWKGGTFSSHSAAIFLTSAVE